MEELVEKFCRLTWKDSWWTMLPSLEAEVLLPRKALQASSNRSVTLGVTPARGTGLASRAFETNYCAQRYVSTDATYRHGRGDTVRDSARRCSSSVKSLGCCLDSAKTML